MGWNVHLVDESLRTVAEASGDDGALRRVLPGLPPTSLLSFIDPYGDTYWNTLQAEAVLKEWSVVRDEAATNLEVQFAEEVAGLLARCRAETHLYVIFIGD